MQYRIWLFTDHERPVHIQLGGCDPELISTDPVRRPPWRDISTTGSDSGKSAVLCRRRRASFEGGSYAGSNMCGKNVSCSQRSRCSLGCEWSREPIVLPLCFQLRLSNLSLPKRVT